jgi:hypothetical protein
MGYKLNCYNQWLQKNTYIIVYWHYVLFASPMPSQFWFQTMYISGDICRRPLSKVAFLRSHVEYDSKN